MDKDLRYTEQELLVSFDFFFEDLVKTLNACAGAGQRQR
jgi:hypothetical protein